MLKRSMSGFAVPGLPLEGRGFNSAQKIVQYIATGNQLTTHATGEEEKLNMD